MLRASLRNLQPKLARNYAAPAVLEAESASPTAAISVVIKAGSRYETTPGAAHVLKNSVFKSTSTRSALRLVRETEFLGGQLSAALTREHLILTAEYLKGEDGFFAELLGEALTQAKFSIHEFNEEVLPQVAAEYEQAIHSPTTHIIDLAHNVAFRGGLGNSLFASPLASVSHENLVSFGQSAFFNAENFTVVGSGVKDLNSLVENFFVSSTPTSALSTQASKYFGGEQRIPSVGHNAVDHYVVAFQGGAVSKPEFNVLKHLLGGESFIKWSAGVSPFSKLSSATSSVKAFNFSYSDAGLVGFLVSAPTEQVASLAQKALAEFKTISQGVSAQDLKSAVAKAKFEAAAAFDNRVASLDLIGSQSLSGAPATLDGILAAYDAVSTSSVAAAAKSALASKSTTVASGNTIKLPYASDLGL